MIDREHGWNVSFKPPILGFIFSLLFTIAIYQFVMREQLVGSVLIATIFGFGALQVLFQLFFFLHLGMESKPRWNSITFLFMVFITIIIVGGSMWIMQNLNYHMMMPK